MKSYLKKPNNSILWIFLYVCLAGCDGTEIDDGSDEGNWIELSDFEGVVRSGAVAFAIADKGYVGTGFDGSDRLQDFWQYDPEKNFWVQMADLPGPARNGATAFAINNRGYVGTGFDGSEELDDFWEYDPALNQWRQLASFGGTARYGAVGMSIDGKGYVGTGFDGNDLKDFWEYDPVNDTWTQKVSVGGSKRLNAFGFVIDGYGYIGGGIHNGSFETDLWQYDPLQDLWVELNPLDDEDSGGDPQIPRESAVAFTVGGKAYLSTGSQGTLLGDTWEYDPVLDEWNDRTDFEGIAREEAVAFVIGDWGYLVCGRNINLRLDDIWSFDPQALFDEDD